LCWHSEGVRYPVEECEHGRDVDRFRDLIFVPASVAKFLNVFRSGAIGSISDLLDVVHQQAFGWREAGVVELAFENRAYTLVGGSLNTQEVSVAVQSIRATIDVGDIAGNHLFVAALQMSFGEMNCI